MESVIFDLDGVVTHTAKIHGMAWKASFDEYLKEYYENQGEKFVEFSIEKDYLNFVDGKPRYEGVRSFMKSRNIDMPHGDPSDAADVKTHCGIGNKKNEYFGKMLDLHGAEVFPTSVELIKKLKEKGVKIGVASSSKNCLKILEKTGLVDQFEARVDGIVSAELKLKGKPDADIFTKCCEMLGCNPAKSVVVEDAQSGVQAGRAGNFGLVLGVDRGGQYMKLREFADVVVSDLGEVTVETMEKWITGVEHKRPIGLYSWDKIKERIAGRKIAIFLDYDGTLTPIVSRPELAILNPDMKETLDTLSKVFSTVIVSGRGREDVASMVGLEHLIYAGSHGFDISGPSLKIQYEIDETLAPIMKSVEKEAKERVAKFEGSLVEYKKYSVAVHYRMVDPKHVPEMDSIVNDIVGKHEKHIKKAGGKMVFEIRPKIDWDKGKALLWVMKALKMTIEEYCPFYIGDDVTDEDALRAIEKDGVGLLVTEYPKETHSHFLLQNVPEVQIFLERMKTIN